MIEQSKHRLKLEQSKLDKDPMLLNLFTDSIDLSTGLAKPSEASDYATKQAQIVLDPAAEYPEWQRFYQGLWMDQKSLLAIFKKPLATV
jgi:hypothetical protein